MLNKLLTAFNFVLITLTTNKADIKQLQVISVCPEDYL